MKNRIRVLKISKRAILTSISVISIALGGCDWIELAKNSFTYRETVRGETANIVLVDSIAYATAAEDGLIIFNLKTNQVMKIIPPPPGSESADDLSAADGILFVLDARKPGFVYSYSLKNPTNPELISEPAPVPVEPFSGISARDGLCFVSGGTSELTVWNYDDSGELNGPIATSDLGRGQPDILLGSAGTAFVSTHYWGPYFGIDAIRFIPESLSVMKLSSLELKGAGFTEGGAKPASFPIRADFWKADTLLVAYARGLAIINVSDPAEPDLVKSIDVGGKATNVVVYGNLVAVAGSYPDPFITLIEAETEDWKIDRKIDLDSGTFITGVALSADYVVAAAHEKGILRFEIKNSNQLIGGDI